MPADQRARATRAGGRRPGAVAALAAAVLLGAVLTSAFVVIVARAEPDGEPRRIAYFAEWNIANRGYTVRDIEESGAAERLTRVLWAFGHVGADGRCGVPADGNQAWELYQRRYPAELSVSGEADGYRQPLAGALNQLRALRERHPGLGASISLGGWNGSAFLSDAALTEESRRAFVASCVDLWLRGDLPHRDGEPQGGPGAAEGVFDGVDLDWEWPGGGGRTGNAARPQDRRNLTLLAAEFRRQLDALSAETGRTYTLSVSLPHDLERMRAGYEPELYDLVDFATVQGYDFTGSWSATTDHHSQLYAPRDAPTATSVDRSVRGYLSHGLPADKLVVGFPGFGRGWRGVPPDGFGRHAPSAGPAEGGYGEGTDAYADLRDRPGLRFLDPLNGTYWIYDGDAWWTFDPPEVVALKGTYARERGLGGLMLWNLDMDPDGELVAAMDESLGEG
ncbi:glycoside hydrolase family 18 protein [Marinitenerispora sediminis]|uniref:chitinase n=1 Tax=Marinitenerispora sediminis TaxID=1931232 RepID=A0A368T1Q5_9ACTN|nr:glycoside hydrolase family 18 protein [Marinitenerispora sediminis]RCV52086.1 glycosyl hydrolase [Marinitenerispora sediminis]RCV54668.1 glycosyl hydrolase [Marinitenerispora sediminis]RCV56260.1 glycosyl hydrolase [Marinitenerispora sediminis]